MSDRLSVTQIGRGEFVVSDGASRHRVWVAGPPSDRWAFHDGRIYRLRGAESDQIAARHAARAQTGRTLTAPMPATVSRVLVTAGTPISRGAPTVVLEAMKMELSVRAPIDGRVRAVYCQQGDLVQADQVLVEIE